VGKGWRVGGRGMKEGLHLGTIEKGPVSRDVCAGTGGAIGHVGGGVMDREETQRRRLGVERYQQNTAEKRD